MLDDGKKRERGKNFRLPKGPIHTFGKRLSLFYEDRISLYEIRMQRLYIDVDKKYLQSIPTISTIIYILSKCTHMMTPNQTTGFDFSKSTLYP